MLKFICKHGKLRSFRFFFRLFNYFFCDNFFLPCKAILETKIAPENYFVAGWTWRKSLTSKHTRVKDFAGTISFVKRANSSCTEKNDVSTLRGLQDEPPLLSARAAHIKDCL